MESFIFFIGILANIASFLLYASPIKTFVRIVRERSTEEFEGIPYIIGLLSSSLWTYYGIRKPGALLVATVNATGVVFEFIYVFLFITFAPPSKKIKTLVTAFVFDVLLFRALVLVISLRINGDEGILVIGLISDASSMLLYASPLASMREVINTKSVEYMPFLLSFFMFVSGGTWTIYALLVKDIFIGIPSGMGFILGSIQLIIYMKYMKPKFAKLEGQAQDKSQYDFFLINKT